VKRTLALLLAAATVLVGGAALSAPHRTTARVIRERATSIGSPSEGQLKGGVRLEESPHLRFLPEHNRRWGLPHLVSMLDRGAARVRRRYPGSVLAVGDLSRKGGGDISGHHSHESGRDADVGFYVTNSAGKGLYPGRFVAFDEHGKAPGGLRFDVARNWALVASWLEDPQARVTHIFVAAPLRDLLLAHARQIKAPISLRNRAALALMQPKHGLPHDNHFHVRIACPGEQRGVCVEYAQREHKEHPRTEGKTAARRALAARSKRPVLAHARKRVGTTGKDAPSLVAVVPAPRDLEPLSQLQGLLSSDSCFGLVQIPGHEARPRPRSRGREPWPWTWPWPDLRTRPFRVS
jgi:penicillin-insensitive murein endopeptidase